MDKDSFYCILFMYKHHIYSFAPSSLSKDLFKSRK